MDAQDPTVPEGPSDVSAPSGDVAEPSAPEAPPEPPAAADAGHDTPPTPPAAAEAGDVTPPAPAPGPDYPPPFAAASAVAPTARKSNARRNLAIALVVAVAILGGGGIAANAVLSSMYSPERAVSDYFAAQSRGDVTGMMANAIFNAASVNPDFFTIDGVTAMMTVAQNKDLHGVKIASSTASDSSTQSVAVSMTWAGKPHSQTYTVRKDNSQTHDLIYHSWHVVIPFVTIQLTLPKQPGSMQVDGITSTSTDVTSLQVVQGYHTLTMNSNFLYDATSQVVDGVDDNPAATFAPTVSSTATAAIGTAVKAGFANCDASKYDDCLNHTYTADPNVYFEWTLPGYGKVDGQVYRITFTTEPTTNMKLVVSDKAGEVGAAGACHVTMTFDGSRNYPLSGVWAGVVTYRNGGFVALVTFDCIATQG